MKSEESNLYRIIKIGNYSNLVFCVPENYIQSSCICIENNIGDVKIFRDPKIVNCSHFLIKNHENDEKCTIIRFSSFDMLDKNLNTVQDKILITKKSFQNFQVFEYFYSDEFLSILTKCFVKTRVFCSKYRFGTNSYISRLFEILQRKNGNNFKDPAFIIDELFFIDIIDLTNDKELDLNKMIHRYFEYFLKFEKGSFFVILDCLNNRYFEVTSRLILTVTFLRGILKKDVDIFFSSNFANISQTISIYILKHMENLTSWDKEDWVKRDWLIEPISTVRLILLTA